MPTLNGTDLGKVTLESPTKESGLFIQPLPLTDSDKALLMDILGTNRTINITGEFTGTKSQIQTFIAAIEALQNGNQGSGFTYVSDLWPNKTVLIQTFSAEWQEANTNSLPYTLTLIEGSAL